MENTNLGLSEEERRVIKDASFILTKNRIIEYVYALFGKIANDDRSKWDMLTSTYGVIGPKISRGENLSGLPWVMLDLPRFFTDQNILAVRTLFWWGNFFSITLHLKGKYINEYSEAIVKSLPLFREQGWSIGVGDDPWNHDHSMQIYLSLRELETESIVSMISTKEHFRISKKYALDDMDIIPHNLKEDRNLLYSVLSTVA